MLVYPSLISYRTHSHPLFLPSLDSLRTIQPYLEEFHTAQDEYRKRLQEYYENASDQLITQINKARSKKGQQRIAPRSQFTGIKRPSVFLPFVLFIFFSFHHPSDITTSSLDNSFLADYKKTVTPPTDRTLTPKDMILYIATSAGKAWKALPEAQKAVSRFDFTFTFSPFIHILTNVTRYPRIGLSK